MITIILLLVMIPPQSRNQLQPADHGYTFVSRCLPISCCKSEVDQKGNVLVGIRMLIVLHCSKKQKLLKKIGEYWRREWEMYENRPDKAP